MNPLLVPIFESLILIPLIGFVLSLFIPKIEEGVISWIAYLTVGLHMIVTWLFLVLWVIEGQPVLELIEYTLYDTANYVFNIAFYFDIITAIFLFLGSFLSFLVTVYSRWYLHRESGYKRFFNTILFFYIGYNLVILSGNFETLFIGWEIFGICSFLLIGYYRERFLPVKNALKIFTVFRIADMGLIVTIWLSHHLWHENITFSKLSDSDLIVSHLENYTTVGLIISLMLVLTAAVKSAQIPFTSWVPRAMEGPTPSSAIFYGSLAVHLGAFLLLRTYPFWEHQVEIVGLLVVIGLTTSIIATLISRVQSSIKTQIAYSSAAQIGLIFIEIALGFHTLAFVHIIGNAFLRTYQLLVSPSIVTYLIRDQFFNFVPIEYSDKDSAFKRIKYSIYLLSVKEFNLDSFIYIILWNPMKWIGRKLNFVSEGIAGNFVTISYIVGVLWLLIAKDLIPHAVYDYFPAIFAFIGLLLLLRSFTERKSAKFSWTLVVVNHLWIALAISFYPEVDVIEVVIYLSGVIFTGILGYACLDRLTALEQKIDWNDYQGHVYEHPFLALVFLFACLGLMGFPVTPTFLGIDLMFTHIHTDQVDLAIILAIDFILIGLSLVRMYSRIFLGPHVKDYHSIPYKSS